MTDASTNNKRILKNTVFLYFRMFFVMGVSLFTSRIILKNLGVIDYGIYNVVGGIVTMMAIVNSSMSVSTQRYITFALGRDDLLGMKKVFSTSLVIYIALSVVLLLFSETIGLWWVNNKLNIPEERLYATNIIYQFSILSCIFTLLINPFNAEIIAHEKMDYYAYLSIAEVMMKLLVAYAITITLYDRLIVYGFLLLVVSMIILVLYVSYCRRYFKECVFSRNIESSFFKELLSYSGWNLFASISGVAKGQGLNVMLNSLFGPEVNASRGVAYQVNAVINQFFSNFYTAVKPQVTIYYSQKDYDNMFKLIFRSAKMSFYLILFVSLPILIETSAIIDIWLGTTIDYVIPFTRLIILISAIDAMATPLMTLMHATGKIRLYQIVIGTATLLILPVSYVLVKYIGCEPTSVFVVSLITSVFCLFARLFLVNRVISIPVKKYILDVFLRCVVISLFSSIIPLSLHFWLSPSICNTMIICAASIVSSLCFIYYIGIDNSEREFVNKYIKKLWI